MPASLTADEPAIRLGCFAGVLVLMAVWETMTPRRPQSVTRLHRWPNNLGIVLLNTLVLRLVFPLAGVGMAELAQGKGWGLLNLLPMSGWIAVPLAVLLLDLTIYGQHLAHLVPWLHRMHHADLESDITTGLRFHPGEILLSMAIKLVAILALGTPPLAVLIFEVLLNAISICNHGNARLPLSVDRVLRWLVVTPDMHRVHHSVDRRETDSNFGFNLPWLDHLFGTYRAQPALGHAHMVLGIDAFREARDLGLDRMLLQPLRDTLAQTTLPGGVSCTGRSLSHGSAWHWCWLPVSPGF